MYDAKETCNWFNFVSGIAFGSESQSVVSRPSVSALPEDSLEMQVISKGAVPVYLQFTYIPPAM